MANRFSTVRGRRRGAMGILLPILIFCAVILLFNVGINHLTRANEQEALEAARTAITRSVVTYYAIEGHYPTSIDYLIEHFGLIVDRDRFIVHYNVVGANIFPQITVLSRNF